MEDGAAQNTKADGVAQNTKADGVAQNTKAGGAAQNTKQGLGCLVTLLVPLVFYGPLLLPSLIAPGHVALGWELFWIAVRITALVALLAVIVFVVAVVRAGRAKEAALPADEASFTPMSSRIIQVVPVLVGFWGVVGLLLLCPVYGGVQTFNVTSLSGATEASCVLTRCSRRRRCDLRCDVPEAEPINDDRVTLVDEIPPVGRRFRATLWRGRLGAWVLQVSPARPAK